MIISMFIAWTINVIQLVSFTKASGSNNTWRSIHFVQEEAFRLINILGIHSRVFLQKEKFVYSISRKYTPSYITNMFEFRVVSNIDLRSCDA